MTSDVDRPAVWVLDPDNTTRHPGREHGRFTDDAGDHVIVLFERPGGLRDYRVVSPDRVTAREVTE